MEIKTFSMVGDATEELQNLYLEGWRLVVVVPSTAVSVHISNSTNAYIYTIDYFLEKN